jgi:hypothetical protein
VGVSPTGNRSVWRSSRLLHDPIAWREVGQAHLRPCLSFAPKRPDSLLHAAEHATRSQQLIDAEPRHRVLGADGLEARYGESDAIRMTSTNEVAQNLGGGKGPQGMAAGEGNLRLCLPRSLE